MTLDEFFVGFEASRPIFDALRQAIDAIGPNEMCVSKSQVAFRRRTGFAYAWLPARYLGSDDVPLVLTVGLRRRDGSRRWKDIVEPARGRFTHHLELRSDAEIDDEVRAWLLEAWQSAGPRDCSRSVDGRDEEELASLKRPVIRDRGENRSRLAVGSGGFVPGDPAAPIGRERSISAPGLCRSRCLLGPMIRVSPSRSAIVTIST